MGKIDIDAISIVHVSVERKLAYEICLQIYMISLLYIDWLQIKINMIGAESIAGWDQEYLSEFRFKKYDYLCCHYINLCPQSNPLPYINIQHINITSYSVDSNNFNSVMKMNQNLPT